MQEIKFRGISLDTWKWVYGYCVFDSKKESANIVHKLGNNEMQHTAVDPKTVSQFTGFKDERDITEIYIGDVVKNELVKGIIVFDSGCFCIKVLELLNKDAGYDVGSCPALYSFLYNRVIGNIYQNRELLSL